MSRGNILCFGEVLWDAVPLGLLPGGAPMNLAYHLAQVGWCSWPVSTVGADALGEEILSRLQGWGVQTQLIGVNPDKSTGLVKVTLVDGSPSYDIVENVAWDHIEVADALPESCTPVRALMYGSLAQRSQGNRAALQQLIALCPDALKVFDVNLRPPFDDRARVFELAQQADLLKVNDEELFDLLDTSPASAPLGDLARTLAERTGCSSIVVTAGAEGAGLYTDDHWYFREAVPIDVKDTIGAGDSFLAALTHGLLSGATPDQALAMAARLAALVASRDGATPAYDPDEALPS